VVRQISYFVFPSGGAPYLGVGASEMREATSPSTDRGCEYRRGVHSRKASGVGNGISHSVSVVITLMYSTARSSHRSTEPCTLIALPVTGNAVSSMHGLSSKLRVPKLAGSTRYLYKNRFFTAPLARERTLKRSGRTNAREGFFHFFSPSRESVSRGPNNRTAYTFVMSHSARFQNLSVLPDSGTQHWKNTCSHHCERSNYKH
jgi:hypothetical protein